MADIQAFAITRLTTVSLTVPNFSIRYLFANVRTGQQVGSSFTGQDAAFFAQFTDAELEQAYRDMIFALILKKAALL